MTNHHTFNEQVLDQLIFEDLKRIFVKMGANACSCLREQIEMDAKSALTLDKPILKANPVNV